MKRSLSQAAFIKSALLVRALKARCLEVITSPFRHGLRRFYCTKVEVCGVTAYIAAHENVEEAILLLEKAVRLLNEGSPFWARRLPVLIHEWLVENRGPRIAFVPPEKALSINPWYYYRTTPDAEAATIIMCSHIIYALSLASLGSGHHGNIGMLHQHPLASAAAVRFLNQFATGPHPVEIDAWIATLRKYVPRPGA